MAMSICVQGSYTTKNGMFFIPRGYYTVQIINKELFIIGQGGLIFASYKNDQYLDIDALYIELVSMRVQ